MINKNKYEFRTQENDETLQEKISEYDEFS